MKLFALLWIVLLGACSSSPNRLADQSRMQALEGRLAEIKPGLGEIMGVVQQHHAKLYYSGMAQNWELADYQLGEIKEGIEDAVKYYPRFKEVKLPLSELVPKIMDAPLKELSEAIHKKNKEAFARSFQTLTTSCNSCHQAAEHGFIVIQVPKGTEFTNQKFAP